MACLVKEIDHLSKVRQRPGQAVNLVDNDDVDAACPDIVEQFCESGSVHRSAGEPAIVIEIGELCPALVLLAEYIGGTGLTLRIQRVEVLLQALFGRLAGVDGAALADHGFATSRNPKNLGPLRLVPVIARATADSEE